MSPAPTALLRRIVRAQVDKQPEWRTPNSWADEDGMYAGHGQVWLYRQMPNALLRSHESLDRALLSLAQALPGREIQILLHTWEHLEDPAPATPHALAAFQKASMQFLVPTRAAVIGVALQPDSGSRPALVDEVQRAADDVLGEGVPEFSAFDADRASVDAALSALSAEPLSRPVMNFLESWYSLGVVTDLEATEQDEMVALPKGARLEFATAGPLRGELAAGEVPSATERGATVLSVRGTLSVQPGPARTPARGVLMRTSVIYGRRAERTRAPLPIALRDLPNVAPRPLPLRQLAALHETLPCSPKRLAATHQRVGAAELRAFGFADLRAPGADAGLLLGTGGPAMARPVLLNPLAGNGIAVTLGDSASGKTFLCEVVATQAKLGGFRVLYLGTSSTSGAGFADLTGAPCWSPGSPGDLDPFRWTPTTRALALHRDLLATVGQDLSPQEAAGIQAGFMRAEHVAVGDLATVLRLSDSQTGVAKLMRALRRHPAASSLVAGSAAPASTLPNQLVVDLSALKQHPGLLAVAIATLLTHVACTEGGPSLVIVDEGAELVAHPAMASALAAAAASPSTAVLMTALARDVAPEMAIADHRFVLSTGNSAAVSFVGAEPGPALMRWMDEATATIAESVVEIPSAGLYRTPEGTTSGFQMGPWPERATLALTRGLATRNAS